MNAKVRVEFAGGNAWFEATHSGDSVIITTSHQNYRLSAQATKLLGTTLAALSGQCDGDALENYDQVPEAEQKSDSMRPVRKRLPFPAVLVHRHKSEAGHAAVGRATYTACGLPVDAQYSAARGISTTADEFEKVANASITNGACALCVKVLRRVEVVE